MSEFEADVTAADDEQPLRQRLEVEEVVVGQIRDVRQTLDRWLRGARPRIDDDSLGANLALAAAHDAFARKRRARIDDLDAGLFQLRGDAVVPVADDASDALHDGALIDAHVGVNAKTRRQTRAAGVVGRRQKRFRGRAAVVDAASAEFFALEQDDAFPTLSGIGRERDAALPAPEGFDTPRIVPSSATIAILALAFAGIAAGLYPARQAALLQPVEALRQE